MSCEWSAEGSAGLTQQDASDILSASVFGASCAESTVALRILTRERKPIYRFDAPLAVFLTPSGDPSALSEDSAPALARGLVEKLVLSPARRTVGDLPSWAAGEIDDGMSFHQHLLPESELLRLKDQPVLEHAAGWELSFTLAFDPRADQVLRVLESWR